MKTFLILLFGIILSGCSQNTEDSTSVITPTTIPTAIVTPVGLKTWDDPSGFTFKYPDNLKINPHPEDNINYSNLTLTDPSSSGEINILMQDDKYKTLDKWISTNKDLKGGNIIDSSLGGKDAKKIIVNDNTIIGVIDNNVLVTLKRNANLSPSLETAWSKISESYEFVYPTPAASKSKINVDTSPDEEVLEEEL